MLIPEDVYHELTSKGEDWADKQAAAELLESTLKSLKAQITLEAKRTESCSMAEATEIALCSADYRDHARSAIEARREATRARVLYDACKSLFDARRTVEASHRATMRAAT